MDKKTFGENLKKLFYSSVGLASHTAEIVQHSVDEFVKQGRVSEEDGKKIVDDAIRKFESRRPELEAKYKEAVDKVIMFANKEVELLKTKISEIQRERKAQGAKTASVRKPQTVSKKPSKKKATPKKGPSKTTD